MPTSVPNADNTLGAHGVASSSNSARPAQLVGSVLNALAPRIAQHVIEIRSAHRNFGARQFRSHFGRNPPQLRIEPQAGFPRRRNLGRQKRHSQLSPAPLRTACASRLQIGDHLPSGSRPSFSLPARENSVVPGGDLHALRLDPAGEVVHLFHRFSREQRVLDLPSLAAAARGAAHRAIEAEADAACEHQRNPVGEAVLVDRNSGRASFEIQFRIPYVMSEWTGSRRE